MQHWNQARGQNEEGARGHVSANSTMVARNEAVGTPAIDLLSDKVRPPGTFRAWDG